MRVALPHSPVPPAGYPSISLWVAEQTCDFRSRFSGYFVRSVPEVHLSGMTNVANRRLRGQDDARAVVAFAWTQGLRSMVPREAGHSPSAMALISPVVRAFPP